MKRKLDKYRIERRIADGGFASVYRAYDTVEGVRVAIKIPQKHLLTPTFLDGFRKEVRLMATLDHPNILPVKTAGFIDDLFLIVYPLGLESLHERMRRRLSIRKVLLYAEQMMEALAYAHGNRIIHCDVKPENLILFSGDRLRLADFGIARFARKTVSASGSGTVGYLAPEQAMGKPSFRSDVFSAGLVLYELLSGHLPQWPFDWPPPNFSKVRSKLPRNMVEFLRRSMEVDSRRRFDDAEKMLAAFRRAKPATLSRLARRSSKRSKPRRRKSTWNTVRFREFKRSYRYVLGINSTCRKCGGPISETMSYCPWCRDRKSVYKDSASFPRQCERCGRGMKVDWRFCPWCYGTGYEVETTRHYTDKRYAGKCRNPACKRKSLMPFMRYCPWCRTKVRQEWKIEGSRHKCPRCRWAVLPDFWDACPWCGRGLNELRA